MLQLLNKAETAMTLLRFNRKNTLMDGDIAANNKNREAEGHQVLPIF